MRYIHILIGFFILGLSLSIPASGVEPFLDKTNLFQAGQDGIALYRIPGIVVTAKGTLLAYCEARKTGRSDWGDIELRLRRSVDGGKTWSDPQKIGSYNASLQKNPVAVQQNLNPSNSLTMNNPLAVVDQQTGSILFLYCVEYAHCFVMRSEDDGKTFSSPADITSTFEGFHRNYDWKVLATGPGHGIQMKNGRLIVPVWLSTGTGSTAHRPSCVSTIYSDDHGKTWLCGEIIASDPNPPNPSESAVVQLSDGRVLLNIRNESKDLRRGYSISPDGTTKWSAFVFDTNLPDPVCMASLIKIKNNSQNEKNNVLFSNLNNGENHDRKNLTIRMSSDDCKTWPVKKTLEAGRSGYSDLTVNSSGNIFCFYERGSSKPEDGDSFTLTLAKFNAEWLLSK